MIEGQGEAEEARQAIGRYRAKTTRGPLPTESMVPYPSSYFLAYTVLERICSTDSSLSSISCFTSILGLAILYPKAA